MIAREIRHSRLRSSGSQPSADGMTHRAGSGHQRDRVFYEGSLITDCSQFRPGESGGLIVIRYVMPARFCPCGSRQAERWLDMGDAYTFECAVR